MKLIFLNKRDFRTLDILINRYPRVVSRDEVIDYVYGKNQSSSHRSVDNTVLGLRHRLGDQDHQWIQSVRGEGYQWIVEKRRVESTGLNKLKREKHRDSQRKI